MRILIQQKKTQRFLSRTGDWEASPRNAWEFSATSEAIKYCVATQTWDIELFLRFRQLGEVVDFPLEDASFAVAQIPPVPRTLQSIRVRT